MTFMLVFVLFLFDFECGFSYDYECGHLYDNGSTIVKNSTTQRHQQNDHHNHHHYHHHHQCTGRQGFAQVPDQPCSFLCPRGHPRPSDSQFDVHNIPKSICCGSCKDFHAATAWKCPCNISWHKCRVNFSAPAKHVQQHIAIPARGNRRPAAVDAQESAHKLVRLEPSITPPTSQTCIRR